MPRWGVPLPSRMRRIRASPCSPSSKPIYAKKQKAVDIRCLTAELLSQAQKRSTQWILCMAASVSSDPCGMVRSGCCMLQLPPALFPFPDIPVITHVHLLPISLSASCAEPSCRGPSRRSSTQWQRSYATKSPHSRYATGLPASSILLVLVIRRPRKQRHVKEGGLV